MDRLSEYRPFRRFRSSAPGPNRGASIRRLGGGFSLTELLITLAVGSILLAAAVPSFRTFVQNSRLDGATDSFLTAIQQARSEAITRGDPVILCRTGDPSTLNCQANEPDGSANQSADWSPGWIAYAKQGYAGSGGTDYDSSNDGPPLRLGGPAPGGVTITSDGDGNQWLAFFADGTLNESGEAQYAVCDDRGAAEGRLIVIRMVGRPYVTETTTCSP